MTNNGAALLKKATTNTASLRERAIAQYHDLLLRDETLAPRVFEKLHDAMRANRLTYGDRPISVALRPHLLERSQFEAHRVVAELIVRALEKIASMAVQFPGLMTKLGLTDAEQKVALIDPGFACAAVTTRLDGFVHGQEIKFVEYNAENPSSLSDQEGLNRVLFELPARSDPRLSVSFSSNSPIRWKDNLSREQLDLRTELFRECGRPSYVAETSRSLNCARSCRQHERVSCCLRNRENFEAHGARTIICSPEELEYNSVRLRCGVFEISISSIKRISHSSEILARPGR